MASFACICCWLAMFVVCLMPPVAVATCQSVSALSQHGMRDDTDPVKSCGESGNWTEVQRLLRDNGTTLHCYRSHLNTTGYSQRPGGIQPVLVGGLLPINDLNQELYTCLTPTGPSRQRLSVQLTEAFLLAVELARTKLSELDPRLGSLLDGVEIRDTCLEVQYTVSHALEMAKRSLKTEELCKATTEGKFADVYQEAVHYSGDSSGSCSVGGGSMVQRSGDLRIPVIVGPGISRTVEVSAPTLSVLKVPHITYWGTSALFEDKQQYPFLFRTVPSDQYQAMAMAAVLKRFGWKFVYAIASNDQISGTQGLRYFRESVSGLGSGHCIAYEAQFDRDDTVKIRDIVRRIVIGRSQGEESVYNDASVVMLFSGFGFAESLFNGIKAESKKNDSIFNEALAKGNFVWLASDGWAGATVSFLKKFPFLQNHRIISFIFNVPSKFQTQESQFRDKLQAHFEQLHLSRESVRRNPWLSIMWQQRKNCVPEFVDPLCAKRGNLSGCCSENDSAASVFDLGRNNLQPPLASGSLWLAVEAAVNAIRMAVEKRPNCSDALVGDNVQDILRTVLVACDSLTGDTRWCPAFSESQDVEPTFNLSSTYWLNGTTQQVDIGSWSNETGIDLLCEANGTLSLNKTCVLQMLGVPEVPESVCAQPCKPSQSLTPATDLAPTARSCCWQCVECPNNRYTNVTNAHSCLQCPDGWKSTPARTACEPIEIIHRGFSNPLGIVIIVLSVLGTMGVAFTWFVFHRLRDHDIVRESGDQQNVMMFIVLVLAYINAVFLLQEPSCFFCITSTVTTATIILLIMSLLMTRSLRLLWICRNHMQMSKVVRVLAQTFGQSVKRQLLLIAIIQLFIGVGLHSAWQIAVPHCPIILQHAETERHLVCDETSAFKFMSLSVILFWMLATLKMVVQSRKAVDVSELRRSSNQSSSVCAPRRKLAVQEAKLLLFAGLALAVLFIALAPTFQVTIRVLWNLIIGLSLICEATAVWCCLYLPRLYVLRSSIATLMKGMKTGAQVNLGRRFSFVTTANLPNGLSATTNGGGEVDGRRQSNIHHQASNGHALAKRQGFASQRSVGMDTNHHLRTIPSLTECGFSPTPGLRLPAIIMETST